MTTPNLVSRRGVLQAAAAATASTLALGTPRQTAAGDNPIGFCLNTSTIRGQQLPLDETIELAAKAGYQGVEPWIREIETYRDAGGSLSDLKKRIADLGLSVPSAIGFASWIVDDPERRAQGLETARRDMQLVQAIGGLRIAAPPAGATDQPNLDLRQAADRYRELLELGAQMHVVPQLELWGFSKSLSRLGELAFVAVESGHPDACMLPDVYHIYKGGSSFEGLRMLSGSSMHVFHVNDYPAEPPRDKIGDGDRVYPGDGVAPLTEILQMLHASGFRGMLSLELFNRQYWQQDAAEVAQTGLRRMQEAVQRAGI